MSLIKTTDELKLYFSGIDKDYKIQSLQSFIDDAEKDILIPWIGQEIYDVISAAYNAGGIGGMNANLLPYLQKAVTHLALMLSADSGSFRIADSGFYVVSTATNKPVSDKKMSDFKLGRRESGYRAMEQAINYLETNITDVAFAAYAASNSHLEHKAYFINDSVTFTRYYKKADNSAFLFSRVMDALDFAERTYIAPVLGQMYFDSLKAGILANSLSNAEKLLMPYICRALVNYTAAKAFPNMSLTFSGNTIIVSSQPTKGNAEIAEDKTVASAEQLSQLISDALLTGKSELRSLEDYLVANAANLPPYVLPDVTADVNINAIDIGGDINFPSICGPDCGSYCTIHYPRNRNPNFFV